MRKYNNTGDGDQFNIENVGQFNVPPSAPRHPVLVKLLGVVQQEVKDGLAQSLHRAVEAELLNLGKVLEPHQVRNPWTMEMTLKERPSQRLPSEMTIAQVFDLPEVGQKLLILGEPGSGKTTTLLELAQSLVEKALNEAEAPIPILVNLSSWKDPKQSIFDWLVGELKSKYKIIRQALGRQFLIQNRLLPFLDGLDEVAPIHQEACALGLNAWLTGDIEQQPIGAVVCCRRKVYEEIVQKRLVLQNSVMLQPLTDQQIETYLTHFQLGTIWKSVQASPQLQDLLRKPLFLAVFGFVAPQFDFPKWQRQTNDAERVEYLFDRFWDLAMNRVLVDAKSQNHGILSKTYGKKELPNRKKVQRALVFAAKAKEQEFQTELLIEKMQPTWLRNKRQQFLYGLICLLIEVLTLGMLGELIFGLIGEPRILGSLVGVIYYLSVGMSSLLYSELGLRNFFEDIYTSMSRFSPPDIFCSPGLQKIYKYFFDITFLIILGLLSGLFNAIFFGLFFGLIYGLSFGLVTWLFTWLIFSLSVGQLIFVKVDIAHCINPNQGIKIHCQNILYMLFVSLLLSFPLKIFIDQSLPSILPRADIQLIFAISLAILTWTTFSFCGGILILQHIALRIVLAWNSYAPYRYDKLLDYCTERLLLQRIGGRYRFMHKLLQEHFAKMPLD